MDFRACPTPLRPAFTPLLKPPPCAVAPSLAACGAHAVNDGLTDLIYVLLPIWQTQFGLSYAQIGLMRGAYSATMAGFQLLASRAARRFGRQLC